MTEALPSSAQSDAPLNRRVAALVFAAVFVSSAWFAHPNPGWNVNSRLNLTYSIVDFGSVEITPYLSQPDYFTQDTALFKGRYYCDKIIGVSLLGVPAYWTLRQAADVFGFTPSAPAKRYITRTFSVSVFAALTVLVLAALLHRMGVGERLAWATALVIHFGTLLYGYSMLFYPYSPAAFFSLLAFYLLMALRQPGGRRGALTLFLAGLSIGAAMLCDYLYLWIFLALGAYAVATEWRRLSHRAALLLLPIGAALPLLIFAIYVYRIFGRLVLPYQFETYHAFEGMKEQMGFSWPRLSVLYYITIHPYRGILVQSPFLIGAAAGLALMLWRGAAWRPEALMCGTLVVFYLLFNASYYMWWGGWTMGPRHLIPMLPFWGFWYALAWQRAGRPWRFVLGALAAVSVFICVVPAFIDPQVPQGHETAVLLAARISDNLSAPQFYRFIPGFFQGAIAPHALNVIWPGAGVIGLMPLALMWSAAAWLIMKWTAPRKSGDKKDQNG